MTVSKTAVDARRITRLLLAVSCGGILAPLNSTMLAVALPDIRDEFSISHAALGWLVSSYLIAMAVCQPIGGRLGDELGRDRVFRSALWAFLAFSLAATLAPTFPVLVLLRTGQALAGAVAIPNGLAMLRVATPPDRLGRTFGLNGAAMAVAAATGPLIGAAVLAAGPWRGMFLFNVPVVVLALILHAPLVDRTAASPRGPISRPALDWLGTAVFAVLLVAVTILLAGLRGASSTAVLLWAAGALAASTLAFGWRLATAAAPTIEWRLFRERSFAAGTLHILMTNLVMYTTLLTVPFFIREVQGKPSETSGLLLGVMSVLMAVMAPVTGRLSDRVGRRLPAVAGSVLVLIGVVFLLVVIATDTSVVLLAIGLAIVGLGVGASTSAASTAAIESAPVALAGSASGTNSMMRYLGSIVGVGVLAGVLSTGDGGPPGIGAFRAIFGLAATIALLAIPIAATLHRFPPEVEAGGPPQGGAASSEGEPAPVRRRSARAS